MRKFDRLADWKEFNEHMAEYLERPIKKYGAGGKLPDLLHFTTIGVMAWNILKYALRIVLGCAKEHDYEKIAHYAQMSWTRAKEKGRKEPFLTEQEVKVVLDEISELVLVVKDLYVPQLPKEEEDDGFDEDKFEQEIRDQYHLEQRR